MNKTITISQEEFRAKVFKVGDPIIEDLKKEEGPIVASSVLMYMGALAGSLEAELFGEEGEE